MKQTLRGETCVLAYSGGLDTSVAVAWLRETYGFEVVTCTGEGRNYSFTGLRDGTGGLHRFQGRLHHRPGVCGRGRVPARHYPGRHRLQWRY